MTQSEAFSILKSGRNAYITGCAGSGKTHLLNQYIQYARKKKISVAVTASTGIAATHLNGRTIHSWSGIGIKDRITKKDIGKIRKKQHIRKRIQETDVLVIDEISMLSPEQFDGISEICQACRKNARPFGGMQVVCSGDFFQLPPVTDSIRFVTASYIWQTMGMNICYLQEQHRHTDPALSEILNAIREDRVDERIREMLLHRKDSAINTKVTPTKLHTHNSDVDAINAMELDKIKEHKHAYRMQESGKEKLVTALKKGCLVPELLEVKAGAAVMFVKNNFDEGYVNGTLGTVVGYTDEQLPVVSISNGTEIVAAPAQWAVEDEEGRKLASISQIPLRLAWAITVHKSQGMTLDAAEVDLSKSFVEGMGYVALSRVRTLDGLRIMGINDMAMRVNPDVVEMDKALIRESDRVVSEHCRV